MSNSLLHEYMPPAEHEHCTYEHVLLISLSEFQTPNSCSITAPWDTATRNQHN